jgi:hypothetical protein
MSRGAGVIEKRISELIAASRHRALTVEQIAAAAFALKPGARLTRVQRLSATRAAHRLLRRHRAARAQHRELIDQAHARTDAARWLWLFIDRIGIWMRRWRDGGSIHSETDYWQTTTIKKRLFFYPPDVPVQVWAVTIDRAGVHWFECEVRRVTERNVMVRYAGEIARLDRTQLWYWWAW